jgi:hypothetical protein
VSKPGRNQQGAEHTQAKDKGNKRDVSEPQEGVEHALSRDEGNKREVSVRDRKQEGAIHALPGDEGKRWSEHKCASG